MGVGRLANSPAQWSSVAYAGRVGGFGDGQSNRSQYDRGSGLPGHDIGQKHSHEQEQSDQCQWLVVFANCSKPPTISPLRPLVWMAVLSGHIPAIRKIARQSMDW